MGEDNDDDDDDDDVDDDDVDDVIGVAAASSHFLPGPSGSLVEPPATSSPC